MQVQQQTFDNNKIDFAEKSNNSNHDQSIQASLNKIINKENFIQHNVNKKLISTDGGNYLGELFEIDITGKTKDGDKEINIFVKKIIPSDSFKNVMSIPEAFLKEMFVYKELSLIYNQLQNEYRVPEGRRLNIVKSYDCSPEFLMLENMSKKGFTTDHRMDIVSFDLAKQSVEQIAKFHALSIVLQKRRPEYFNANIKKLKPFLIEGSDEWNQFLMSVADYAKQCLDRDARRRVEENIIQMIDKYTKNILNPNSFRCLCHGDFRPNNALVKRNGDIVSEVFLIDYQLIHYGSPVHDLIYYIFLATDQEFRRKYLDELKVHYFNSLSEFLKVNFNLDVELIYPITSFEKDFRDKLDYGVVIAFMMLPFIYVENDSVPDLSNGGLKSIKFNWNNKFKDRIRGAIDDFIRWGYL